jgi:hypothetical protein
MYPSGLVYDSSSGVVDDAIPSGKAKFQLNDMTAFVGGFLAFLIEKYPQNIWDATDDSRYAEFSAVNVAGSNFTAETADGPLAC